VLLHHLETHIGIVVLITNKPEAIDSAFQRRIRFSMTFPMPDAPLR
jgi:SpoVK/Ycf46/Vps4 family AAA+-type ATPase